MTTTDAAIPPTRPARGNPKAQRPFGWRDKIGYMFGDFGNDFTFILQASFFMIFYTNVMGINPGHVGTLLLVARIVDAFTDVGAGRLIDILPPGKSGRFKPWLLRIMIPVAVAGVLMFTPILQDGSYGARLGWMTVTYFLWGSVFYTLINIPYGSMASVISNKPEHRASLSVFRSLGAMLANIGISIALPLVVYVQIDGQSVLDGTRMMWAAIACAVCAVICYIISFANVEERVTVPPKEKSDRMGFGTMMKTLITNRALTGMILSSLFMLMGMLWMGTLVPYVFNEYFNNGQLLSVSNLVGMLPMLLVLPFATALAKKFGKREVGIAGMILGVAAGFGLYIIGTDNPFVFIGGQALLTLGITAMNVLTWALITDVIDYQEVRSGERNDATVYGMYSWARKLGQALAGGLGGWSLLWIGYESSVGGGVVQSESVLNGIYGVATLGPATCLALSGLFLAFWYPLSKKRVEENVAFLAKKHAAEGAQVPADSAE